MHIHTGVAQRLARRYEVQGPWAHPIAGLNFIHATLVANSSIDPKSPTTDR
jgi:hypothetical protein